MIQEKGNFIQSNIYLVKGKEFQKQGNFEEAILCYQQVIHLDPNSFWGHHLLGHSLEKQNQQDEAIAAWLEAISLNPNHDARYYTHYSLACVLKQQGELGSAIYHCQEAILLKPERTDFCDLLADIYISFKKLEPEAIYKAIVNSAGNRKEYHQSTASNSQTQSIHDSSVSASNELPYAVFSYPLEITILGTSAAIETEGYCKHLIHRLNAQVFSEKKHTFNKFCLGASSSILACFYALRNHITISSSLVLLDFCINDRNLFYGRAISKLTIAKSIEGCIRYIKSVNFKCQIVFINMSSCHEEHLDRIKSNECEVSILYESIADYYNIPVIDVSRELIGNKGKAYFKLLYSDKDPYHPIKPLGAKIIGDTIYDKLSKLNLTENYNFLPEPLYPDNYSDLQILESDVLESFILGSYSQKRFKTSLLQENYFSLIPGSSIEFCFKGTLNGIYYMASHDSGYLVIEMGEQIAIVSLYTIWNAKDSQKPKSLCLFENLAELQLVSHDFVNVKLSLLNDHTNPQNYIGLPSSCKPPLEPANWKFNVISLTYQGEVRALN